MIDSELMEMKAQMLGSLLEFTRVFYQIRTGRQFNISKPIGRESHQITICRALTETFYLKHNRLLINIEPGSGKSELCVHFVAWALAHYPDCNFIYTSISHSRAAEKTSDIKKIIEIPQYRKLFDVHIDPAKGAADNFKTTAGGHVCASGSKQAIVGANAGLPVCTRFSGALIMDDMHNPDEVTSDVLRERVINIYQNTLKQRVRSPVVPSIFIGQITHEADLANKLKDGLDGHEWNIIRLPSIDDAGNVLNPTVHPEDELLKLKEFSPYVFATQYQQQAIPSGGAIFKEDWFHELDNDPNILVSFITGDTAETDKDYNDKTVFSFWGLYEIVQNGINTKKYGLHWLDCVELQIEPVYLEAEFMQFYSECCRYKTQPSLAAIEKKSTGVTLLSVLKKLQGIQLLEIGRSSKSGNKTSRFLSMQPYIAKHQVTFTRGMRHIKMCKEHMGKITANETHRWDDIADTAYDAVKIALIDNILEKFYVNPSSSGNKSKNDFFKNEFNFRKQVIMGALNS
ncbi:MAG: hypothetical protein FK731_15635 [Asgard group archaeon]|nr:hypothetical protein [Asgard group archaeon]